MEYIDGSAPLSEEEVEDLNDLPNGSVPVKTEGGFGEATLFHVPDSTAGAGRAAVTTDEKAAVEALAGGTTTLASVQDSTAGAGRKAVTTAGATASNALGDAGVTAVTGTGKAVLDTAPTITGATINELTPALITRISLLEYVCANDFDPSVSGIVGALVGARCSTVDGATCWQKYGVSTTDWRSLNETRATATASGGPGTILRTTIACGLSDGLVMTGVINGALYSAAHLEINASGAAAGMTGLMFYGSGFVAKTDAMISAVPGTTCTYRVEIGRSIGGLRRYHSNFTNSTEAAWSGQVMGTIVADAISSVGIIMDTNKLLDGTSILALSSQRWGVEL